MNQITYIKTADIFPHPRNPRKELGDVTELAESIRVNGVLQNLTVVEQYGELTGQPTGRYTVVIGHRRLAAAKLAGIDEVPCIISQMTGMQQLRTMLTENMQRSDLTVYEQAKGFQMMLDLGDTATQIAERTGFSAATVRRRVKLLDLDEKGFQTACGRGATLMDFARLDDVEDADVRNDVLKSIGTNNFENALRSAIDAQKERALLDKCEAALSQWAQRVESDDVEVPCSENGYFYRIKSTDAHLGFYRSYTKYETQEPVEPDDSGERQYYYERSGGRVYIYRDPVEPIKTLDTIKKEMRQKDEQERIAEAKAICQRHQDMREEFVTSFTDFKRHQKELLVFAGYGMLHADRYAPAGAALMHYIGVAAGGSKADAAAAISEHLEGDAAKTVLMMAYDAIEKHTPEYAQEQWDRDMGYKLVHAESTKLTLLYNLLSSLGYQMSDEELAMQDGTHKVFREDEADAALRGDDNDT